MRESEPRIESETMERKTTMADKTKAPELELFDQALKNYEQALRTGVKVQEEAGRTGRRWLVR